MKIMLQITYKKIHVFVQKTGKVNSPMKSYEIYEVHEVFSRSVIKKFIKGVPYSFQF